MTTWNVELNWQVIHRWNSLSSWLRQDSIVTTSSSYQQRTSLDITSHHSAMRLTIGTLQQSLVSHSTTHLTHNHLKESHSSRLYNSTEEQPQRLC